MIDYRAGDFLAALRKPEVAVTAAATALVGRMHVCTGTSADYTVTLPPAAGCLGQLIGFRMGSAAALNKLVTLDGNASETIDGSTTRVMWANESAVLMCDGSNWFKIAGKTIPMTCNLRRSSDSAFSTATWSACPMNAQDSGNAQMYDSVNGRVKIVRPGRYMTSVYVYVTGDLATGRFTYGGPAKNATDASGHTGFALQDSAQNALSTGFAYSFDCALNDYLNLCAYTNFANPAFLGAASNSIDVFEILTW